MVRRRIAAGGSRSKREREKDGEQASKREREREMWNKERQTTTGAKVWGVIKHR